MRKIARILVSALMLLSSLLVFNKTSDAKTTDASISKNNKQLILQHAKSIFAKKAGENSMVAWHSSHSSHSSHGSHYSHSSHYSSWY